VNTLVICGFLAALEPSKRYIRAQQRKMCSINLALLFSVGGGLTRLSSRPGSPAVEMYVWRIDVAGNAVEGAEINSQTWRIERKEIKGNGSGPRRRAKRISLLCMCVGSLADFGWCR
jgi:hypothetical protein